MCLVLTSTQYASSGNLYVGASGVGTYTQSGGTNTVIALCLGNQSGSSGVYNLNNGVLSLTSLSGGSGSATFNFSGGTLRAGGSFSTVLPMTLGAGGGATFDPVGFAVTLSGPLTGPGGLTLIDGGTLTLAVTNTYSGNTLISGGTLALGSSLALQNSTLDTSGGGVLNFGSLTAACLGGLAGPGADRPGQHFVRSAGAPSRQQRRQHHLLRDPDGSRQPDQGRQRHAAAQRQQRLHRVDHHRQRDVGARLLGCRHPPAISSTASRTVPRSYWALAPWRSRAMAARQTASNSTS